MLRSYQGYQTSKAPQNKTPSTLQTPVYAAEYVIYNFGPNLFLMVPKLPKRRTLKHVVPKVRYHIYYIITSISYNIYFRKMGVVNLARLRFRLIDRALCQF